MQNDSGNESREFVPQRLGLIVFFKTEISWRPFRKTRILSRIERLEKSFAGITISYLIIFVSKHVLGQVLNAK